MSVGSTINGYAISPPKLPRLLAAYSGYGLPPPRANHACNSGAVTLRARNGTPTATASTSSRYPTGASVSAGSKASFGFNNPPATSTPPASSNTAA